ncbi:Auxilliary activities family 12 protein [Periconia macrospinosa]|uniref:Auxilliary activities family 12 protein n=1 Tax=Periconia macrospinosa TaxID=97972 RepID=A0A2V1D770_9PLEO|nr:Auxilliary activities family 12 protein [Periconia macrospinosa]
MRLTNTLLLLHHYTLCTAVVRAQSSSATASATPCSTTIALQSSATPSVAAGWQAAVVANSLTSPRGIKFDSQGGLLVVEQEKGIVRLTFSGEGSCARSNGSAQLVIDDPSLNHGLELSEDGRTLYASSEESVFAWQYDPTTGRNTSGPRTLINRMTGDNHVSRTLLLSKRTPGQLLVSRGSQSNLDVAALDITSGISTIKSYNLTNTTDSNASPYNHAQDGVLLGWGLRNSVGLAEHPVTGGIYSVENSVDNIDRSGKNIHQNNPGEELNFHGYLNGTVVPEQGDNYGYPICYAAWNVGEIPNNDGLQVGSQFAIGNQNATVNDTYCREGTVPPRLTFEAHMAPLDIVFNSNGTAAWVSFHGSWNRDDPIGYKLSVIAFDSTTGNPRAPANSTTSYSDVLSNADLSRCPDQCFRPVGLAWDSSGRLFMSSDSTGEIFVLTRTDGSSADSSNGSVEAAAPDNSSSPDSGANGGVGPSTFTVLCAFVFAMYFTWIGA